MRDTSPTPSPVTFPAGIFLISCPACRTCRLVKSARPPSWRVPALRAGAGLGNDGRHRARRRLDVDDDAASVAGWPARGGGVAADGVPPPVGGASAGDGSPPDADADGGGEPDGARPCPSADDYAAVARAGVVVHASALHAALFNVLFFRAAPADGGARSVAAVTIRADGMAEEVAPSTRGCRGSRWWRRATPPANTLPRQGQPGWAHLPALPMGIHPTAYTAIVAQWTT